jgi:hypothetical protein
MLVVHRRGWTSQVIDLVHLDVNRKRNIVANDLEARVAQEVRHVSFGAGKEVIKADHLVAILKEPLTQVGPQKASPSGHKANSRISIRSHNRVCFAL